MSKNFKIEMDPGEWLIFENDKLLVTGTTQYHPEAPTDWWTEPPIFYEHFYKIGDTATWAFKGLLGRGKIIDINKKEITIQSSNSHHCYGVSLVRFFAFNRFKSYKWNY